VLDVVGVSNMLHGSLESVVGIGGVLHDPGASIGLLHGVSPLDLVPVPGLPLLLDVSGLGVLHSVVEFVLGVVLGLLVVAPLGVAVVGSHWCPLLVVMVLNWRPRVGLVVLVVILPLLGSLMVRLDAVSHCVSVIVSSVGDITGSSHTEKRAAEDG